jgi:hypothetical protein
LRGTHVLYSQIVSRLFEGAITGSVLPPLRKVAQYVGFFNVYAFANNLWRINCSTLG